MPMLLAADASSVQLIQSALHLHAGGPPDKRGRMFALNAKMPLKIESATHFQGIEFSDAGGDGDCGYRALAVAYAEPNHFPYLQIQRPL